MTIIGGTGALGFGLALRLGRAGVPVVIGSRAAERAAEAAGRARERVPDASFEGLVNPEAAARSPGQLLIDGTVPLAAAVGGRATRMLGVPQGSAAQQAAEMVPDGVRVVSALHTVSAQSLSELDHALDEDVLICGDSRADKREAAELLGRVEGLRCVDAGRLEMSRIVESLTALMISINGRYKTHAGVRVTGLPEELWADPSSS